MTKILFLVRKLGTGGAERQLVALACGLRARGTPVEVGVFYAGGALEADLHAAGVPIRDLGKRHRWDLLGPARNLFAWLRAQQPAVLHGYLVVPNIVTALVKPFVPGLKIVWGVRASGLDFARYDWTARATFLLSTLLARFADLIIVNSVRGRDFHLSRGYPASRIVVVPNGIDTKRFRIDPQAGRGMRGRWGIPEDSKLVGLVARLDPMKDHPTFLRAVARCCAQVPELRFVCVGGGTEKEQLTLSRQARQLGVDSQVRWAGPVRDMNAAYNALDLLVLASRDGEGFPNALGEALACGVPCVATDVGDARLILGETGEIAPVGDDRALAAAILKAVQGERSLPREELRTRVQTRFSIEALVAKTLAAIAGLEPVPQGTLGAR
jgi:glycosyltransferase involved in cell wall biosynthesis